MNKVTIGIIIALLLGLGGLAVYTSLNPSNSVNINSYDTTKVIAADENNGNISDHVRGKEDSEVVVVEYADPQCPGCASMMPKMSQLHKEYGDRVAFIFRTYPMSYHQNARSAAAAAESAGFQGFYWEMLETLYANQADWENIFDTEKRTNTFAEYFEKVAGDKADVEKFKSDLTSSSIQKKIDFDRDLAKKRDKVSETPSLYINGTKINFRDVDGEVKDHIEKQINDALKAKGLETGPAKNTESEEKTEE
ncbi:MAG: DsbA family protein [Candidatus Saccharibacteria bacterium]|nr:DsbA family protein [Candidatus Saccharibacteria bacterium]